jgi:holliday junction DNA helicase RuvB
MPAVKPVTKFNLSLRPQSLSEYIGCENTKKILNIAISATKEGGLSFNHTLLVGQRGMGKTALAEIICKELGAKYRLVGGGAIRNVMDLNSLMMSLTANSFLIIDEVHGMDKRLTDLLHQAMDKFLYTYSDVDHRIITIQTPPFSLIAATTSEGKLTAPFLSRFRRRLYLEPYTPLNLQTMIMNCAKNNGISIDSRSAYEIAVRSNGVPRLAVEVNFVNVYEYALRFNAGRIDLKTTSAALEMHGIDSYGLNPQQRAIIGVLDSVALGLQNLESRTGISQESILNLYEPYLLVLGFIERTSRGRILTPAGKRYKAQLRSVQ